MTQHQQLAPGTFTSILPEVEDIFEQIYGLLGDGGGDTEIVVAKVRLYRLTTGAPSYHHHLLLWESQHQHESNGRVVMQFFFLPARRRADIRRNKYKRNCQR